MIVQVIHTVETNTATVPLPIMILKMREVILEKIASGTLPDNVRCRMVLPGAAEEGTSTQRSFTLWEGGSVEEIRTEVLAILKDHCTSEFVVVLDEHCIGLDKSEWVPMREKLNRRMSQMASTVRSIDEKNKISEKTAALADSTRQKAGQLYDSTGETMKVVKEKSGPVVSSGLSSMKMGWSSMVSKVQDKAQKANRKTSSSDGGTLDLSTPTLAGAEAASYGEAEGGGAVTESETESSSTPAAEEKISVETVPAPASVPEPTAEQTITDLDDIAPAAASTDPNEDSGYETVEKTEKPPELL